MGAALAARLWLLSVALSQSVVITLPADSGSEAIDQIVQSCERVLGVGGCRVHLGSVGAVAERHRAELRWEEEGLAARLRLHTVGEHGGEPTTRQLRFAEGDSQESRNEAIGLVIAAYVLSRRQDVADEGPARMARTARPQPPPQPSPWVVELLLTGGPALSEGPPRFGLLAYAGWRAVPSFGPLLGFGAARRFGSEAVQATWLTPFAGVGWVPWTDPTQGRVEIRAGGLFQALLVAASDPSSDREARSDALRWGGRVSLSLQLPVARSVWFSLGGHADLLYPRVSIYVLGERVGVGPPLSWALHAGLHFGG